MRHPFAQCGDGDFATDDDERHKHVRPIQMHQHQQRSADEELVGHGVQKRAKGRRLIELAGQVAVGPIGERKDHEHHRGQKVACVSGQWQVEDADDQWDGHDARPCQQSR